MSALADVPLPCPFCDHDYPEFVDQGSGPPPMWAIICGWCGAKGSGGLGFERGDVDGAKRAAVKEWNRAPRPATELEPGRAGRFGAAENPE